MFYFYNLISKNVKITQAEKLKNSKTVVWRSDQDYCTSQINLVFPLLPRLFLCYQLNTPWFLFRYKVAIPFTQ